MRPKERQDSGQRDMFRARLDQIVDMSHPLARLAHSIEWGFLETSFGAVYSDVPGRPPLPTRLMAGLAILKHTHDLSDETLCDRISGSSSLHDGYDEPEILPSAIRPFCLKGPDAGHVGGLANWSRLTAVANG
jgi:hypothetical protein